MSDKLRFGEILVRAGVLERATLEAVARDWESVGGDLGELLVKRQALDEALMIQTVGKALNVPSVTLDRVEPDRRALDLLSRGICQEFLVLPLEIEHSRTGEHLHLAMANPSDVRAIKTITRHARLRIRPLVAAAREIRLAIARFYGGPPVEREAPVAPPTGVLPPPAIEPAPALPKAGPALRPLREPPAPPPVAPPPMMAPPPAARPAPPAPPLRSMAPPAPPARPASTEALFDFGVMDLSELADAEPEPPAFVDPPAASAGWPGPAATGGTGLLGGGLMDLLDTGEDELDRTSDLLREAAPRRPAPTGGEDALGSGFGVVSRNRRVRSEPPGALQAGPANPRPAPARTSEPLPPLPPLRSAARPAPSPPPRPTAGSTGTSRPLPPLPPSLRSSRPPEEPPPRAPEPPPPRARPPEPAGLVEDPAAPNLRGVLERYNDELNAVSEPEDEVIAEHLARYGRARPPRNADAVFDELEQALARTRPGAGLLLVGLVRHLARRGLVDPAELLAEIAGE